jgi:hypothetical protein
VIVFYDIKQKGLDPFGEPTSGSLLVNGRLKKGIARKTLHLYGTGPNSTEFYFKTGIGNECNEITGLWLDSWQLAQRLAADSREAIGVEALLISHDSKAHTKWIGLALERKNDSEGRVTFRRVGLVSCHKEFTTGYDWFDDCYRPTVEIVWLQRF